MKQGASDLNSDLRSVFMSELSRWLQAGLTCTAQKYLSHKFLLEKLVFIYSAMLFFLPWCSPATLLCLLYPGTHANGGDNVQNSNCTEYRDVLVELPFASVFIQETLTHVWVTWAASYLSIRNIPKNDESFIFIPVSNLRIWDLHEGWGSLEQVQILVSYYHLAAEMKTTRKSCRTYRHFFSP